MNTGSPSPTKHAVPVQPLVVEQLGITQNFLSV